VADVSQIYLIPTVLHEEGLQVLPAYILEAIEKCEAFFVENERSARRFLKQLKREIVIDNYEWVTIGKAEGAVQATFKKKVEEGKIIGIVSEAGCPGVADPGQLLIKTAQELDVKINPLVGPSSILLALMASGMNGQNFSFHGYLPIDEGQRMKALKELETVSAKTGFTQIFIETPYRNNQMIQTILKTCSPRTRLCIAVDITGSSESIKTKTIAQWKNLSIDIHKKPAIFLLNR